MAISAEISRATSPTPNIQKYALSLELEDPGFDRSVLSEFRARLAQERAEQVLLTKMLEHFREAGLLKVRGHARTDSTHVLASVRQLHKLENITNWGLTQFRTRYKDDTINGVKVLLDTHTFLWFIEGDSRIGSNALAKFSSPATSAFSVSPRSGKSPSKRALAS